MFRKSVEGVMRSFTKHVSDLEKIISRCDSDIAEQYSIINKAESEVVMSNVEKSRAVKFRDNLKNLLGE